MLGVAEVQLMIELGSDDCARMRELMLKYRDLPMDLADAALVRVAECERAPRVFTVDWRDVRNLAALSVRPLSDPALIRGMGALLFSPIS